jgi:hypothetical protein
MAQTILVFDFGTNEEAVQQARHKIEGWKQAFRLDKKILLKFERKEEAGEAESKTREPAKPPAEPAMAPAGKGKTSSKEKRAEAKNEPAHGEKPAPSPHIRLFVRLDFSDHEKLSHQRWLGRIPAEEPFKSVKSEAVHHNDPAFTETSDLFDSLD